jgi:hypothetical protein
MHMSLEFSFIVQKMDKGYKFIAKQYGVIVWAPDIVSGIKDLEARVDTVTMQLREAGFDLDEIELSGDQSTAKDTIWSQLVPFSIKVAIVAVVAAIVLIPLANVFSKIIGPASPLASAISHPAQFVIRLADQAEQVPPQTIEEMKLAVRKIIAKIGPVVDEVRAPTTSEQSSNPRPTQK